MSENIMELAKILRESDNIVFFGGDNGPADQFENCRIGRLIKIGHKVIAAVDCHGILYKVIGADT